MIKKYLLTGGPSSGKTSILLELELRGEKVIRECAEDYIRVMQAKGVMKPWENLDFQDNLLKIQIRRENNYNEIPGRVFVDGGILDFYAYHEFDGREMDTKMKQDIQNHINQNPYEKTFFIDNFGICKKTDVRRENFDEGLELERLLLKYYGESNVIHIPKGDLDERVNLILKMIK